MMKKNTTFLTQAAIIAAAYAVLAIVFGFVGYGAIQFRIAEALTVLPYFTPAAIPGLFIGCIITNLFGSPFGIWDIVFGSLATLIAAILTYMLRNKKFLAPLPPVVINAVVVGLMIALLSPSKDGFVIAFIFNAFTVGLGEVICCYGLGLPLIFALNKYKDKIFKLRTF